MYDNGHEAIFVRLCSDGNESAVMKQECINNSFSNDCEPQASPGTSKSNNAGLYVGIGMTVALIVILCILLVIVRYRRQKSTHFPQIDIAHQNQTSPYEFANARVETEEHLDNVSRPFEFSQQNSAEAYRLASQTTSANNCSLRDLKSTEQNKLEDELVEVPVAYDIAQIDDSKAQKFEQVSDQDLYVIETPDVSNAYEIAMQADPNVYKIEDSSQHAESNLPAAQSIEGNPKLNNTYSSLQSSGGVVESAYSKLKR